MLRLKLHQHIHIAVGPEIVTQHRAEQRQLANVMLAAEGRDLALRDNNPAFHTHYLTLMLRFDHIVTRKKRRVRGLVFSGNTPRYTGPIIFRKTDSRVQ
jgi:hypothetical protein